MNFISLLKKTFVQSSIVYQEKSLKTLFLTLIDHGADVNVHGLDGDTPLHDAAANGHEEITIVLIQVIISKFVPKLKFKVAYNLT